LEHDPEKWNPVFPWRTKAEIMLKTTGWSAMVIHLEIIALQASCDDWSGDRKT